MLFILTAAALRCWDYSVSITQHQRFQNKTRENYIIEGTVAHLQSF